jgi:puromycin-sensitive aminopeptidase
VRDFRLTKDIRPTSYDLRLDLDLERWTFAGTEAVAVRLAHPTGEISLHSLELNITRAVAAQPGNSKTYPANVTYDTEAETATLRFDTPLAAGAWELRLEFSGEIQRELRGLYRSTRPGERYAATQFAPADARRAFPCFDEPEFKARFALELIAPAELAAIANAPIADREEQAGGRARTRFAETPPISSYLLAFAVGPFEATPAGSTITGVPVRVWVPRGMSDRGLFARDAHVRSLEYLERYTGIPYPYGKVDAIGLPDFSAGAMENPGAITYRLTYLVADAASAPVAVRKNIFGTAAHELTHMWWGDLVTLAWWDDIWLNESFATFVGEKARAALEPDWAIWRDFVADTSLAFGLDALLSTHPISAEVRNARQADERFDAISYEKGAAVLRMLEGYLGETRFRDGVRAYLDRYREANATADDFWRALDESSGENVTRIARSWITEPGHPLVSFRTHESADGLRVELSQRRFLLDPDAAAPAQRWPVPVVIRYETADGPSERRVLLDGERAEVELPGARWYFPNARGTGFYRYSLDQIAFDRLIRAITALEPEERLSLLDDVWMLARAGAMPVASVFALLRALSGERDRAVLQQMTILDGQGGVLAWLDSHVISDAVRPAFAAFTRELLAASFSRLGLEPRGDDSDDDRELRAVVLEGLGRIGRDPELLRAARARIDAHLAGSERLDPDVATALARVAAADGDSVLVDRFVARMSEAAATDPQEELRFRGALAYFEEPRAARRAVEVCFGERIRDQDFPLLLHRMLQRPRMREHAWAAVQERWESRVRHLEPWLRQRVVTALSQVTSPALSPAVARFLEDHRAPDTGETTDRALERLRVDAGAARRMAAEVEGALRSAPAAATT